MNKNCLLIADCGKSSPVAFTQYEDDPYKNYIYDLKLGEAVSYLPSWLIRAYQKREGFFDIYNYDEYLAKTYGKDQLKGSSSYYSWNTSRITIRYDKLDPRTITHELGHYIHCKYVADHATEVLYKSENNSIVKAMRSTYSGTNARECFAEAFYLFVIKPDVLKDHSPKYYDFMLKVMDAVKTDVASQ